MKTSHTNGSEAWRYAGPIYAVQVSNAWIETKANSRPTDCGCVVVNKWSNMFLRLSQCQSMTYLAVFDLTLKWWLYPKHHYGTWMRHKSVPSTGSVNRFMRLRITSWRICFLCKLVRKWKPYILRDCSICKWAYCYSFCIIAGIKVMSTGFCRLNVKYSRSKTLKWKLFLQRTGSLKMRPCTWPELAQWRCRDTDPRRVDESPIE